MNKKKYFQKNEHLSQIVIWSILLVVTVIIVSFLSFTLQQNQESLIDYLLRNNNFISSFSSKTTLSLQTNIQKYSLKNKFPVEIWLNIPSGKKINGVDVVMDYNSSFLKTSLKNVKIISNSNLNQLILPKTSPKSGKLCFSIIARPGKFLTGSQKVKIAEVKFLPIKKGNTSIKLEFSPLATDDSNVVLFRKGTDILKGVNNLRLHIE